MSRNTLPPSLTVAAALLCILVSVTAMPLIEADRSKSSWFAWAATAFATLLVGTAAAVVLMGTAAAKAVTSTTLGAATAPEKLLKGVEDEDEKWMASCVQSFGEERCNAGALDVPSEKADEADEEVFESTDAGSSLTYPMEGGQIHKGDYIMIKGHPCKVSDVSTSKTGKHGHAKCHFVAIDIFTGKKMEVSATPRAIALHFGKRPRVRSPPLREADYLPCRWPHAGSRAVVAHYLGALREKRGVPVHRCRR